MTQLKLDMTEFSSLSYIRQASQGALNSKAKRENAKKRGLCTNCLVRPVVMRRTHCSDCLMNRLISEAFKFDRQRKFEGMTERRGTCYVDQFSKHTRKHWIEIVKAKWTGKCFYSGLLIEIGSTAGLDHMLPVSRVASFGPLKVFHPDNLVWTAKGINRLKGDMTADEFHVWLRQDLPAALATVDQALIRRVA